MKEEWRPVPDWDGYEVSDRGRLRSWRKRGHSKDKLETPFYLNPSPDRDGYLEGRFSNGDKVGKYKVHRVVAETFHGPQPSPVHQVAHGDGVRTNNHVDNIRWATPAENGRDRILHGNHPHGQDHNSAVLTEEDVRYIRKCNESGSSIAKRLGVFASTVNNARKGKTWRHLDAA